MIDRYTYCLFSSDGLAPFLYAAICTALVLLIVIIAVCVRVWRSLSHLADTDAASAILPDRRDHMRTKL